MHSSICVLGAGSWGTALAIQAARNGNPVLLWGHNAGHMADLSRERENKRYLPGFTFPGSLTVTNDISAIASFSPVILISVPSHAFKNTLIKIKPLLSKATKIAWATKGFNPEDGLILSDVVGQSLPLINQTAVISGPTFAQEVASGLPTAITVASASHEFSTYLANLFHNQYFRVYTCKDLIGVQIGGAVKNVLAIAAGIADGLGYGANTRAALITRGLQEIMRLGMKLGGQKETFMGLTGLGDLILTCTDNQSRNRRFGLAMGQGLDKEKTIVEIGQEVEGLSAARETYLLSLKYEIDMPIVEQTYKVLYEGLEPGIAVKNLLARELKAES